MAESIEESARRTPVVEDADVVVCGAGPAGVAAAIAAGRAGAHVRLLELHGCLGGVWTAGMLSCILDVNKPGLIAEILTRLEKRHSRHGKNYHPEAMKLLLEEMCAEAGVSVQLHTAVVDAVREGSLLSAVVTESKSGRQAWRGKVYIDTTGDGDLSARAGCGWSIGRPNTGEMQPMSLMALFTGLNLDGVEPFIARSRQHKNAFLAELKRAGVTPSYTAPTLFHLRDDLFAMMVNHEYGVSGINAADVTAATLAARAELNRVTEALRSLGGVWANLHLIATADQIGVREGRRIHGRYTVTADDLIEGRQHPDAVTRVTFGVDIHATRPDAGGAYNDEGIKARPYDIPLRALIAKDVCNLMMAGRCISGDFIAHASYRVTGNAVAMGEAAGVTAARAAKSGRLPHQVPWDEIQSLLFPQATEVRT